MARALTLLSSGNTAAHKQGSFPCAGPLTAASHRRARSMVLDHIRFDDAWIAPDPACLQVATAVGLSATVEPALAEQDYGSWAGRTIRDVMEEQPEQFAGWMRGRFTPGTESMEDVFARVRRWLSSLVSGQSRVVAVAPANVVRACVLVAFDLTPAHLAKLDISSLTLSKLTSNGREWRVRSIGAHPAFSTAVDRSAAGASKLESSCSTARFAQAGA